MAANKKQTVAATRWPRCIYLAGVDGTGKTTQARALLALLEKEGVRASYAWLRFPRLFCVPLLAYARLRGYSVRERVDGVEHGYWYFHRSWLMSHVFPWLLWLDTLLLTLVKVYLPLWRGYTVVCDRFVADTLVDLMAGVDDDHFDERLPGRLFFHLLPRGTYLIILDLDSETAKERSEELKGDRSHGQRRTLYLKIADDRQLSVVESSMSVAAVTTQIVHLTNNGTRAATTEQPGGAKQMVRQCHRRTHENLLEDCEE